VDGQRAELKLRPHRVRTGDAEVGHGFYAIPLLAFLLFHTDNHTDWRHTMGPGGKHESHCQHG
jgi:hypothetical protein